MLYQTSTFAFIKARNLDTSLYFSRTIRPERLVNIRCLYIRCETSNLEYTFWTSVVLETQRSLGKKCWVAWRCVAAQIKRLRDVRVRLTELDERWLGLGVEEDWVKSMLEVRGLRAFGFEVECRSCYEFTEGCVEELGLLKLYFERNMCE